MSDQECGGMSAPGVEHERLRPFVGTFQAEVKMWMGPGDPMVMTGTMRNALDLGGRFLRQTYTGDPNPGPFPAFEGRGFWGYNDVTRQFEGFWIDNACNFMQMETGDVDQAGKVWTMTGEVPDPQGGGTMSKRSVITLENDNRHSLEMWFRKDGHEFKAMEIRYRRRD